MSAGRRNFLSATPLDRLGHRRADAEWLAAARLQGRYLAVWQRRLLVSAEDPPVPLWLPLEALAALAGPGEGILLGTRGEDTCFALALDGAEEPALGGRFADVRGIGHLLSPDDGALLAYARAMALWHERHGHCSACGAPTLMVEAGHARSCPACAAKHFPRVDPAIIVLVADEGRCLLGRQASWPPGRYSTIAGFVEPGESLEDAVRREVLEETGIETGSIEYHSSQPWPFPSSLMLGFTARPEGGTIALRDGELEDARWLTREEIAAGRVRLPPKVSIAWRLIEHWYDAAPGRALAREADPGPWVARPET